VLFCTLELPVHTGVVNSSILRVPIRVVGCSKSHRRRRHLSLEFPTRAFRFESPGGMVASLGAGLKTLDLERCGCMPEAMTSWKEIASYFGKGVRTVQRWERCHGLPVRRHSQTSTGPIFAFAEEMEIWVRAKTNLREVPDAGEGDLDRLRRENQVLRERIKAYEQAAFLAEQMRDAGIRSGLGQPGVTAV
jgi:hypothetical protein